MDHCQVMMGIEAGRAMRETFERVMGEPCPCSVGRRCPLREPAPLATPQVIAAAS